MNYVKWLGMGLIALSTLQCEAQNIENSTKNTVVKINNSNNISKIELTEMTRGTNRSIEILSNSKNTKINGVSTQSKISSDSWAKLNKEANSLSLEKLNSYAAPTTDRYHDGALAATIKITTASGQVYESQSFDAGKPPKELAALYNLLSPDFVKNKDKK